MSTATSPDNQQIYTIPSGVSFADTLVAGLMADVADKPEKLATYLILLPTRRACRSLQEAFLRQTDGKPILLPRLQPFGDIDAEELFISGQSLQTGAAEIDIPPAMSALKRQILLAHTIAALPDFTKGPEQDMALAHALGQLMDQIHTENLNLTDLPDIVDRDAFAEHWQITVDFLKILSVHWPRVLEEHGVIDAADRRNRLINALNHHWQQNPPSHPIIAAGSTGSIPATAALLKTIANLPQGSVILPGLDQNLSDNAWGNVTEGHPQATLKQLLERLDCPRSDVKEFDKAAKRSDTIKAREKFISQVMIPPENTDEWQKIILTPNQKSDLNKTLTNVKRYDCKTPQEEADLIGVLLRETLEEKNTTAALITSDRNLARRVAMTCRRWNIEIDDSGGQSLTDSGLGGYLRLSAEAAINNVRPLSLLALLKHDYAQGAGFKNFRFVVRQMDHDLLRGAPITNGFNEYRTRFEKKINDSKNHHKPQDDILNLINHLDALMTPLIAKFSDGFHDFSDLLKEHLRVAEKLAGSDINDGANILWQGEEGEAAAIFLSELQEHTSYMPSLSGPDYLAVLEQFMKRVTIRPRFGTHPRLMILGQLEARLIQAERVILAGLNEGSWPPNPGHDPWMSRPMRTKFGLPTPERDITLAAHDFVQGFCGREVFLTRASRVDGAPTQPARWLQRLDTFLQAIDMSPDILCDGDHKNYISRLDKTTAFKPVGRPEPRPPVSARPTKLSVTKIEKWLQDPYAIYAEKILRLRKLDSLEKQPDAAIRGTLLHSIMERFTNKYKKDIPDTAADDFISMTHDVLAEQNHDAEKWSFWIPRMARLADWIIPHEQKWRSKISSIKSEAEGEVKLSGNIEKTFTLTARADRIDTLHDGSAAIIDYKSGGSYSAKKIESGELPQLPLEALILTEGGFAGAGIQKTAVSHIGYWKLTGGKKPGEVFALRDPQKLEQTISTAKEGLINLVHVFENDQTPYMAIPRLDNPPRFNDYEYLERVKEWAALDEASKEAA